MKVLLTSALVVLLASGSFASCGDAMGCHDRQLHCTAPLLGVALHPTWQEKRIREWRRAKAAMSPQEFEKWERHWRQEVERQRRDNNRLAFWVIGFCFVAVLCSSIVSRRKNKSCSEQGFRVSPRAIIAACQKSKTDRQDARCSIRREHSRTKKPSSAGRRKNGHGANRRTGLFGSLACVCSWAWFLALAVLTGCISYFFDVAPNVPDAGAGLVGLLIFALSLWSIASSKACRRRGLSHFANCVAFLGVALVAAFAYAVWLADERQARLEWPTMSGVIRTVERREGWSYVDSKYGYVFCVDGREYAGEFSERVLLELSSANQVATIGKTRERNVGDAVTVFYDPRNPADSFVRVPSHGGQSFWAGFLLVLTVVVIVFTAIKAGVRYYGGMICKTKIRNR